jgi:hypothetical protein
VVKNCTKDILGERGQFALKQRLIVGPYVSRGSVRAECDGLFNLSLILNDQAQIINSGPLKFQRGFVRGLYNNVTFTAVNEMKSWCAVK